MSFLDQITVLVLTFNEEHNIARTLSAVAWATRIVVVDSGSTDRTVEIASQFPQVRTLTRPFDNHQAQWSFGLAACADGAPWVLALDADYVLTPALRDEIAGLSPSPSSAGYRAAFRYAVRGRVLRGSLYPAVTVLYRRDRAAYVQSGHTQRVVIDGALASLKNVIIHDDRKPLSRWVASQANYARLEAEHLISATSLRRIDRIRLMGWLAPILVFFYTLLVKGCILDGLPGWHYVLERTFAEMLIALEIADRRLGPPQVADGVDANA